MEERTPKIARILDALRGCEPEAVYLFGSWARDEGDELSDVDLVVIKATPLPFFERLFEIAKLLPPDSGAVDLLVYTPEEFRTMLQEGNMFAEMIAEEGVLLYGNRPED